MVESRLLLFFSSKKLADLRYGVDEGFRVNEEGEIFVRCCDSGVYPITDRES